MRLFLFLPALFFSFFTSAQKIDSTYILMPDRVFDGETMHSDWIVIVQGNKIVQAGPLDVKPGKYSRVIKLKGTTLLPGLIEGHSHLFLHPYNETSWNDQVLTESRAERLARAVVHAKVTLMAGFTTERDLGTEGSMYDDAGLKTAIEKNIIPGPRLIVATRAIVAKGAYGPNLYNADIDLPQGAAEVGNIQEMEKEVRIQLSKGADVIKIYADYRQGPDKKVVPTFSVEELITAVRIAKDFGKYVVVHSSSAEGMKRSIIAGVHTIEHGDNGTPEIFAEMKRLNIAYCPTLSATEAISQYEGWKKGIEPDSKRVATKKRAFAAALKSGVTICMGGDVGVFPHGDNAREMELMVEYGMNPIDVLRSATSVNADVFQMRNKIGRIKEGLLADLIVVEGDPSKNIHDIRNIRLVMKEGKIY